MGPEQSYELTTDDLDVLHKMPVGDYFTVQDSGEGVLLHDISTHTPLVANEVPQSIQQTSNLAQGIAFLRSQEPGRFYVPLVLGPHGSAEDFQNMLKHHSNILTGDWVGLEMSWRSQYMSDDVQPDNVIKEISGPQNTGRRAFQSEQLVWAYDNGKHIIPCEIAVDDTSQLSDQLRHLWNDIYEPLRQNQDLPVPVRNAAMLIAERTYQAARQWAIVAQLGNWLMRLDAANRLPQESVTIPLVLGSWHANSVHRLRSLGIKAEAHTTPDAVLDQPAWKRFGELVMQAQSSGRMGMDLLATPQPY